ncbi:hypothetical protein ACQ4LE_002230 [Meloidogyne hapla]
MQIPNENNQQKIKLRKRIGRSCFCNDCLPCMPFSLLAADSDMLSMNLLTNNNDFCPGGGPPIASCSTTGLCAPPMQCLQPGICCVMPQVLSPPPSPLQQNYACPGGLPVLGQCIDGRCMSPAVCSTPANVCCAQTIVPTAIPATVCPDGTQAAGACVNGQCGAGFTCNQGLCCSNSSQTPRCLDGSQSIGACIQGRCGTGYTCTTGNICCPSQLNPCPPGQVSIGLAVNGRCPTGYTLISGQCCGTQSSQLLISCPQIDSSGPCDKNQQCSEPGFACDKANNWCCPQVFENEDPIGPCIEGEGGTRLCPEGYACVGDGEGECKRLDTGTCAPEEQLGPCGPNNECPAGYECIEGFCCRIDNGGRNGNIRRYRRGTTKSIVLQLIKNNSADREVHTN